MCLAIPMQIIHIEGTSARCAAKSIERDASLFLLQGEPLQEGDYVLIHVGYAIQKLSEEEAMSTWALFEEVFALEDQADTAELQSS